MGTGRGAVDDAVGALEIDVRAKIPRDRGRAGVENVRSARSAMRPWPLTVNRTI